MVIRMTSELRELVGKVCDACGLDASTVMVRTARSLELRPVLHNSDFAKCVTEHNQENAERVTASGTVMVHWRGQLPMGATPQTFRERLYFKCLEALASHRDTPKFVTPLVEGRDYIVKGEMQ